MATDPSRYKLNHTMLRVKDPERSLKFYNALGLTQINKLDFPQAKFTLYFLAYDSDKQSVQHGLHWTDRHGVLELTHNHGTEADAGYRVANGNEEPHRGFGHICISVDNIGAACKRLEAQGWPFQKRLADGRMKTIAFVRDPDGYWVELVRQRADDLSYELVSQGDGVRADGTDPAAYRLNHTMLRVKDPEKSLAFYRDTLGMKLLRHKQNPDAKFDLYFLAFEDGQPPADEAAKREKDGNPYACWEGVLELTHNYGTEDQPGKVYHNGNAEPKGFGHVCVTVDDIAAACQRFDERGVEWQKRLTDGTMKDIAFLRDPDGYWVEVIQNNRYKKSNL
ncbi:Lactoylglutathione lyase [Ascosphaera acerosa]|nr:Lactoylglutathione lyase [Ascosphaera acerosa]